MSWFSGARKLELQPESDSQPAITPTQFIVHSLAAPWTVQRTYEFWRDSTNLESHFAVAYDGDLGQFIGTQTRADANASANLRPDGTGAVSLESASNTTATDPWTPSQVSSIVRLGVWLHREHAIPLRICRTSDDPGFGYHRQFSDWNPNNHSCPGDARINQFHDVIFPRIVAAASEDPMPELLTEVTSTDLSVASGAWKTLTFGGLTNLATNGTYSVLVNMTITGLTAGDQIQGRFYHDTDGVRVNGPVIERIATDGSSFPDFAKIGAVGANTNLRFEILAFATGAGPYVITSRQIQGLGWV
jgi:hypothetical protein